MTHTAAPFDYDTLTARNAGYVSPAAQQKMRSSRLLFAGCGIGSSPAVCAARMGYENFVLADGDTVDAHNLNRQFYDFADIGRLKVEALRDQILRINPQARVQTIPHFLDAENTAAAVQAADIVFDTVDFLDLPAILRLHETARACGKPIFTALSVGFGALVWYFPAKGPVTLLDILTGGASADTLRDRSYAEVFAGFVQRLAPYLDTDVVEQVGRVLALMKDGKPCPAPQVAVGSFAIGAMSMSMIYDMLAGNALPTAPSLVLHSFKNHRSTIVDLTA